MKKIDTPPYTITTKILKLSTKIAEEIAKLEYDESSKITPILRKKTILKLWQEL